MIPMKVSDENLFHIRFVCSNPCEKINWIHKIFQFALTGQRQAASCVHENGFVFAFDGPNVIVSISVFVPAFHPQKQGQFTGHGACILQSVNLVSWCSLSSLCACPRLTKSGGKYVSRCYCSDCRCA